MQNHISPPLFAFLMTINKLGKFFLFSNCENCFRRVIANISPIIKFPRTYNAPTFLVSIRHLCNLLHSTNKSMVALPRRMTFPRFFAYSANQISSKCHSHFYGPTKMRNPTRHQASGMHIYIHTYLQAGTSRLWLFSPAFAATTHIYSLLTLVQFSHFYDYNHLS